MTNEDKKYNKVIFYDPEERGMRLAICWTFEKGSMLGHMYGYEGGGNYGEHYFKAVCKDDKIVKIYSTSCVDTQVHWESDWMSDRIDLPEILQSDQDRCYDAMTHIMDDSIIDTTDNVNWNWVIPESNFQKMKSNDDGTLIFIEIEDKKQLELYKQLQPRWNFLSHIEFHEDMVH
ncbi:hypothetical protein H8D29_03650 [PVC group bacterium]|nr:hypothetical protein [PVC group bacterium]